MIKGKFKSKGETYSFQFPEGWDELTLSDYIKFKTNEQGEIEEEVSFEDIFCRITEIPKEVLRKVKPAGEVNYLLDQIAKLFGGIEAKETKSFKFKGTTFYVEPDIANGEWGLYNDALNAAQAGEKDPKKLAEFISIVCRPKGEDYDHEITDERIDEFMGLDFQTIHNVTAFFLTSTIKSQVKKGSKRYSRQRKAKKKPNKLEQG